LLSLPVEEPNGFFFYCSRVLVVVAADDGTELETSANAEGTGEIFGMRRRQTCRHYLPLFLAI